MIPSASTTLLVLTSVTSTSLLALVSFLWRRERAQFVARTAKLLNDAAAERKARIRHEIAARESRNPNDEYPALGFIRTMFAGRYGTPRQGSLAKSTLGVIQIDSRVLDGSALDGLEKFSFAWLLFIFHENTNEHKLSGKKTHKSKIKAPGLLGEKTGLLATRSPHRPSRLGLSLVKIVKVEPEKSRLTVSAVDLLDGTPIVDIKPYVPMDAPWEHPVRYPEWVARSMNDGESSEEAPLDVHFTPEAKQSLEEIIKVSERSQMFFSTIDSAVEVLKEALRLDFRAVHHGRYAPPKSQRYEVLRMKMCDFELEFSMREPTTPGRQLMLLVTKITPMAPSDEDVKFKVENGTATEE